MSHASIRTLARSRGRGDQPAASNVVIAELEFRRWCRLLAPLWQAIDAISDGTKCDTLWYDEWRL